MQVDRWPIIGRSQLIRAFRPGERATKEAPFRTLRTHGWATAGVSVVTRNESSATGRLTIFSVLNMDAARLAREGEHRGATTLAKAAATIEASAEFLLLKQFLTGHSIKDVSAVLDGGTEEAQWTDVHELLKRLARETNSTRARCSPKVKLSEVFAGKLSRERGLLILNADGGGRTAVPPSLAKAVHRENVGDCLALETEQLDDHQMVVNALPGIDTGPASAPGFSPFGRNARVHALTKADAKRLAGTPAPLRILVPVAIGA